MQIWRFLLPSSIGFTVKNLIHAATDKLKGAPGRSVQAASYVAKYARQGDAADVLRTLDKFAREERWLMSVGPDKGPMVEELAARMPANPRVLELGAFCGYSSIMLAQALGADAKITSVDINADSIASATANAEHAGLAAQIEYLHGRSNAVIEQLTGQFDLVFLDHWKDLYKSDLELIEKKQLIKQDSIVVADNVGQIFGPEKYLNYVRNCGRYKCESRTATIEYTAIADAVEISTFLGDEPANSEAA